jgi:hypothetical protein
VRKEISVKSTLCIDISQETKVFFSHQINKKFFKKKNSKQIFQSTKQFEISHHIFKIFFKKILKKKKIQPTK